MSYNNLSQKQLDQARTYRAPEFAKAVAEWIEEQEHFCEDMIRLEPREFFDPCIKGIVNRINLHVLCYDSNDIIIMLQDKMGMDHEEAIEHYQYNIEGSFMGENSPVFLNAVVSD